MKIKRMTAALVGVGLLLALGVLLGQSRAHADAVPSVLRAQKLELVDRGGVVRASLVTYDDGAVVFRLMDEKGTIRVKLGAGKDGSGLVLANEKTEPGLHLLATKKQTFVAIQRDDRRRVLRP